ncbi:hypothetical protein [Haloprofundus salilacus]|uniref:hypothetical protein n=1 Tax=Haloprofundus salilacus TaxID=2876190 RepID=UPI001CCB97D3|nr:hypothetical protein [Haloprofundus salilacus]
MAITENLTKVLPRTNSEIDLEITAEGSAGEKISVHISVPDVTLSNSTTTRYRTHRFGTNGFWFETMEDALRGSYYTLKPVVRKSESGSISLHGGLVTFEYYHDAQIGETVADILKRVDEGIVLENRRKAVENQEGETTQQTVIEDIVTEIGTRDLTERLSRGKIRQ